MMMMGAWDFQLDAGSSTASGGVGPKADVPHPGYASNFTGIADRRYGGSDLRYQFFRCRKA